MTEERLQTEAEHHTAKCIVCNSRINVPWDPYCCAVCANSHKGKYARAMEAVHNDKLTMTRMTRKAKNKITRKRMR